MPPPARRSDLSYDDRTDVDGPEGLVDGKLPWPKAPDEADVRWVPYQKGLLSLRDPFTGERHEIPTEYHPGASKLPKTFQGLPVIPAPRWMVRRAMEKLPPRKPEPRRTRLPAHLDDEGPL